MKIKVLKAEKTSFSGEKNSNAIANLASRKVSKSLAVENLGLLSFTGRKRRTQPGAPSPTLSALREQ